MGCTLALTVMLAVTSTACFDGTVADMPRDDGAVGFGAKSDDVCDRHPSRLTRWLRQ